MKKHKKNLPHSQWVKYQFDNRYDSEQYRDVIIHTSLIESTVIAQSEIYHLFSCINERGKFRTFSNAIKILRKKYYKNKKVADFKIISDLRDKRNELIHGIMKEGLDQNQIEKLIKEVFNLVKKVYRSNLFNQIFCNIDEKMKRDYGFLPKDKVLKFK